MYGYCIKNENPFNQLTDFALDSCTSAAVHQSLMIVHVGTKSAVPRVRSRSGAIIPTTATNCVYSAGDRHMRLSNEAVGFFGRYNGIEVDVLAIKVDTQSCH